MNQELINKYLRGEAQNNEKLQLLQWIEANAENRKEFMQFRRLYDSAIWRKCEDDSSKDEIMPLKHSLSIGIVKEWMKVAAVIAFAILGTLFFQKLIDKPALVLAQTIEVPQGQHVNLTLSDGTKVSLNSNSRLQIPSSFDSDSRKVILDGEGYFKVAHNANKPFHVMTKKCDIRVLGTTFNVLAYDNSNVFETSLIEGSVRVSNLKTSQEILLKPKQRALLENGRLLQTKFESEDDFLWRKGIYVFNNESLEEIFQKLEDYYQIKIVIHNRQIRNMKCTGKFFQQDGLDHIMRVLKKSYDFNYQRNEEADIIEIM